MKSIVDQKWFSRIKRPSRYMGNEINAVYKDPFTTDVSIALAFPDLYEVGMSHQGLKILYHILNTYKWLAAERVFAVWVDLEKELRDRKIPLTTLESHRPLSDFDIVGFSLQHELSFSNVLNMLDLSGVPFLSSQRNQTFPLVIAGGPACFNPEPIADLFDAIVIGDGEEPTIEICNIVRMAKRQRIGKEEILMKLSKIQGLYIPSLFSVHYNNDDTIRAIEHSLKDYPYIKKAVVSDINQSPFPFNQVVPFTSLVHDRLAIEIARGCTRGCRFCQAGMIYRPLRERDPNAIIRNLECALRHTGFDEISLLSLSSGDYSCITPLLKALMDNQSWEKIAVSLPSLRIDSMDPVWFEQIKRVRKTGFTLAPEVGSERLRKIINKTLTNDDIINMAKKIYEAGWNLIKLYFMVGLPGEEEEDLQHIIDLSRAVVKQAAKKGKNAKLNVSLATFVPKAHTPFMWAPQITLEESLRRIQHIRDALRSNQIRVKWNPPESSWLEGIFARGDRRLTTALIDAWHHGARFDAWRDHFSLDIWRKAFEKSKPNPEFYLYRSRNLDEVLPWDHIRSGITKEYLKREWIRAIDGKTTPDCRDGCLDCGVCDHVTLDIKRCSDRMSPARSKGPLSKRHHSDVTRYRITFSKTDIAKYLSHLELVQVFIRAINRAGLIPVYSKGYHPMPKVSFLCALPVGTESMHETVDIELYESISASQIKDTLDNQLPRGVKIIHVKDISLEKKRPVLKESHYEIQLNGMALDPGAVQRFMSACDFPIVKKTNRNEQIINARSLVKSLRMTSPNTLEMIIKNVSGPTLKPIEIAQGIFQTDNYHMEGIKILKTKQIMG